MCCEMLVLRDLEVGVARIGGGGLGRDQSFLVLIMEALRYQDLWSHMGETEGQKEPGHWCPVHVQLGKVWD